MEVYPCS